MDPRAGVRVMKRKIQTPAGPARILVAIPTTPHQLNSLQLHAHLNMNDYVIQLTQKILSLPISR